MFNPFVEMGAAGVQLNRSGDAPTPWPNPCPKGWGNFKEVKSMYWIIGGVIIFISFVLYVFWAVLKSAGRFH